MAQPDPKTPTPTQPDPTPAASPLIPVAAITFPAGVKLALPGRRGVWNSDKSTPPSASEYRTIHYDPRMRHHIVAHFATGKDPKRPPVETLMIPEGMVTWKRAT